METYTVSYIAETGETCKTEYTTWTLYDAWKEMLCKYPHLEIIDITRSAH